MASNLLAMASNLEAVESLLEFQKQIEMLVLPVSMA